MTTTRTTVRRVVPAIVITLGLLGHVPAEAASSAKACVKHTVPG